MKPAFAKDEHFEFLIELRKSRAINMLGASPYLVKHFGLTRWEAKEILAYWMRTFTGLKEQK